MSKPTAAIRTKTAPRVAERMAEIVLDDAVTDASGQWLVLIGESGEASDPDEVLRFFRAMWPDVE